MNKIVTALEHGCEAGGEAGPQTAKQPYVSPELKVYGDLREITMSVSLLGAPDNALPINPLIGTAIVL